MWPCIVTNFFIIKPNRCTNFPNLFWLKNEPLHVSGSSSTHHQESINCTLGTGICHTVWRQLPSWAGMELSSIPTCWRGEEASSRSVGNQILTYAWQYLNYCHNAAKACNLATPSLCLKLSPRMWLGDWSRVKVHVVFIWTREWREWPFFTMFLDFVLVEPYPVSLLRNG